MKTEGEKSPYGSTVLKRFEKKGNTYVIADSSSGSDDELATLTSQLASLTKYTHVSQKVSSLPSKTNSVEQQPTSPDPTTPEKTDETKPDERVADGVYAK